jgi:hypothetical protein
VCLEGTFLRKLGLTLGILSFGLMIGLYIVNVPTGFRGMDPILGCGEHSAHSTLDGWEPKRGPGRSHPRTYQPLREAPAESRT